MEQFKTEKKNQLQMSEDWIRLKTTEYYDLSACDKFCLNLDKIKFKLSRYGIKLKDLPNVDNSCSHMNDLY